MEATFRMYTSGDGLKWTHVPIHDGPQYWWVTRSARSHSSCKRAFARVTRVEGRSEIDMVTFYNGIATSVENAYAYYVNQSSA